MRFEQNVNSVIVSHWDDFGVGHVFRHQYDTQYEARCAAHHLQARAETEFDDRRKIYRDNLHLERRINSLRGVITKLKKRINHETV